MINRGLRTGFAVVAAAVAVAGFDRRSPGADYGAILEADANRIDADIAQLQADRQKLRAMLGPDTKAVAEAQKRYDEDAAPFLAQLKADEAQAEAGHKAGVEAIKADHARREAAVRALEEALPAARQRAAREKSAGATAELARLEEQAKAARRDLLAETERQHAKLKADQEPVHQKLAAQRSAMTTALQSDLDALEKARRKLKEDSAFSAKVDADRAALAADLQKLETDKLAAGQ